ncbi:uncharacterized protein LOC108112700 [Drosophila eugracilis]|uniref:uncharacterized protein LOC108112700 n=1 Tax=Drosophila eugracilis TaxID=29029 RepID=UPI0007E86F6E|nr:uncharacterized protein LOC108112700 [Drosophila eugracilis]
MVCYLKFLLLAVILFLSIDCIVGPPYRKCGEGLGFCTPVRNRCKVIAPPTECRDQEKCCSRNVGSG